MTGSMQPPTLGPGLTAGLAAGLMAVAAAISPALAKSKKEPAGQAAPQVNSTPAKPKVVSGSDPGGIAVALIGSGVNYLLPQMANRLARDGEGDIIGLDFIDRDNRPFDVATPDSTPDGVRPLGTTLASVLLWAAPVRLVPVRIRLGEPRAFGGAAAFVASTPARIAIVAFASPTQADWEPFRQAALAAPNVLFVIPAGDTRQDLDKEPLYPASLGLPNAIVVTTADAKDGKLAGAANGGVATVDVAVTAVPAPGLTLDGAQVQVTGTRYEAAVLAAIASNLLAAGPRWSAVELKARIIAQAVPMAAEPTPRTRHGIIVRTVENGRIRF